ncbi:MAG: class I SAM-dependent methyltransferase, partial [Gallionellaceae bacterium]|nr:class I SAM-dependent methyltransferase [Gallionellaceae bacterium]
MSTGDFILGAALYDRAASDAAQAKSNALYYAEKSGEAEGKLLAWKRTARSHVHSLRACMAARKMTEDQLIAALKAENANHPLASREAVDAGNAEIAKRGIGNVRLSVQNAEAMNFADGTFDFV